MTTIEIGYANKMNSIIVSLVLSLFITTLSHTNSLVVKGCDFQHDAPQVNLGNSLKKAVIIGNIFSVRLLFLITLI